ncbi:monocarboxylate transporter [Penicillium nucicola]|uniref:monocarboxylate transporter n=1 Tax=Penicillium nucicola TaxID=1850975 RepID=UPI0025455C2C|nr:monocarboxylate transporter [Penicillium nucicola]KAJ5753772.1 monocarboxylate transporter [Penicillium nucicola]
MITKSVIQAKGAVVTSDNDAQAHPVEQLDGGVRAWTVAAGAWCCLFCAFGWLLAFSKSIIRIINYSLTRRPVSPGSYLWSPLYSLQLDSSLEE